MIPIPLRHLAAACDAEPASKWLPDEVITSVSSDTRSIGPHSLFVALKGERFDGHDFLSEAAARGAAAAIVSTLPPSAPLPLLKVSDTLIALGRLGRHLRQASGAKIVGVTGSVGKTTVKEMTALVLGSSFHTLKSEANHNNEIGVPSTLLRLEPDHRAAVIEMGMRAPGEIQYLSEIAQPDAATITNIGVAHIGRLRSRDAIAEAKAEILVGLKPDGTAILNRDDDYFSLLSARAKRILSFGMDSRADVRACCVEDQGFEGARFRCQTPNGEADVNLSIGGSHLIVDSLAALAAGLVLGAPLAAGAAALSLFQPIAGRGEIIRLPDGRRIINDAYNATPHSMESSLRLLASMSAETRKVAVLGDMLEMGEHTEAGHRQVGQVAARSGLARLVCVGTLSEWIQQEAVRGGMSNVHWYADSRKAAEDVRLWGGNSDVILVKGSNGTRMDVIVQALIQ